MKTLSIIVVFCTVTFMAIGADSDSIDRHHQDMWTTFIRMQLSIGDSVEKVDQVIGTISVDRLPVYDGGTGHFAKYYAIDDFIQIRAEFSPDKKLVGIPTVEKRTKWRRYPDGGGIVGQNVR